MNNGIENVRAELEEYDGDDNEPASRHARIEKSRALVSAAELAAYKEVDPEAPEIILREFATTGEYRRELGRSQMQLAAALGGRALNLIFSIIALGMLIIGAVAMLLIFKGEELIGAVVGGSGLSATAIAVYLGMRAVR